MAETTNILLSRELGVLDPLLLVSTHKTPLHYYVNNVCHIHVCNTFPSSNALSNKGSIFLGLTDYKVLIDRYRHPKPF